MSLILIGIVVWVF